MASIWTIGDVELIPNGLTEQGSEHFFKFWVNSTPGKDRYIRISKANGQNMIMTEAVKIVPGMEGQEIAVPVRLFGKAWKAETMKLEFVLFEQIKESDHVGQMAEHYADYDPDRPAPGEYVTRIICEKTVTVKLPKK